MEHSVNQAQLEHRSLNEMEKIQFNYSMKNIPLPSKHTYRLSMIDKAESLIVRMRWKVFRFVNELNDSMNNQNNYGFKSSKSPPPHKALAAFEDDLFEMIRTIKFRDYINPFQKKMSNDIKQIMSSEVVYVPADRTTNMYKLSRESYDKLLHDNITAD